MVCLLHCHVSSLASSCSFYIARDPIGVTCLYIGWGRDGSIWAASEMKCLKDDCARFQQFPPGHYYSSTTGQFHRCGSCSHMQEACSLG